MLNYTKPFSQTNLIYLVSEINDLYFVLAYC